MINLAKNKNTNYIRKAFC